VVGMLVLCMSPDSPVRHNLRPLRLLLRSGLELVQPLGGFDYQPRRHASAEADATDLGWMFQLGPMVECSTG
ncbi:hypothetical protein P3E18_26795, partial [Pseudomonas aeruginosa]